MRTNAQYLRIWPHSAHPSRTPGSAPPQPQSTHTRFGVCFYSIESLGGDDLSHSYLHTHTPLAQLTLGLKYIDTLRPQPTGARRGAVRARGAVSAPPPASHTTKHYCRRRPPARTSQLARGDRSECGRSEPPRRLRTAATRAPGAVSHRGSPPPSSRLSRLHIYPLSESALHRPRQEKDRARALARSTRAIPQSLARSLAQVWWRSARNASTDAPGRQRWGRPRPLQKL